MCWNDRLRGQKSQLVIEFAVAHDRSAVVYDEVDLENFPMKPRLAVRLNREGRRELADLHWGLVPQWAKDVKHGRLTYNCRDDSLLQGKPTFRGAFRSRRCLLLASSYFERVKRDDTWRRYEFSLKDRQVYAYAGLWERRESGGELYESCTMVTVEPNEIVAPIQEKMPAILRPEAYGPWLSHTGDPRELLPMLQPYPAECMTVRATNTLIDTSARVDEPDQSSLF